MTNKQDYAAQLKLVGHVRPHWYTPCRLTANTMSPPGHSLLCLTGAEARNFVEEGGWWKPAINEPSTGMNAQY